MTDPVHRVCGQRLDEANDEIDRLRAEAERLRKVLLLADKVARSESVGQPSIDTWALRDLRTAICAALSPEEPT